MKSIKNEPLFHFLLLGLVIYVWQSQQTPAAVVSAADRIQVGEEQLVRFYQYQASIPDRNEALRRVSELSPEHLSRLVDAFVEEEVLVREAVSLGLDKNDQAMRQRLVQKARYALQAFAVDTSDPDAEQIAEYYLANRGRYRVEATASFSHLYFSVTERTPDEAFELARQAAARVNSSEDENIHYGIGDRFLYNRNYARKSFAEIESHFGVNLATDVFKMKTDKTQWQGPVRSEHGVHLILLTDLRPAYEPNLEEIENEVAADLMFERQQEQLEAAIRQLVSNYKVTLSYP